IPSQPGVRIQTENGILRFGSVTTVRFAPNWVGNRLTIFAGVLRQCSTGSWQGLARNMNLRLLTGSAQGAGTKVLAWHILGLLSLPVRLPQSLPATRRN